MIKYNKIEFKKDQVYNLEDTINKQIILKKININNLNNWNRILLDNLKFKKTYL